MTKKSGLADSPFFPSQSSVLPKPPLPEPTAPIELSLSPETPLHHDTMPPSNRDTVIPRHHDTNVNIIEVVRKGVREVGKEAATHRFTLTEKNAVADVIYHCKQQGIKSIIYWKIIEQMAKTAS
jgi:hypothetical protein